MTGLTSRRVWTLAAAAFVMGLAAFLPAKMLEARINQSLTPAWNLSASGSVWTGFGVLHVLQSGRESDSYSVPVSWQFDPLALARLRVGWNVVAASPSLSGTVKIGAGLQSVEFRDATLDIDAGLLRQALPVIALFAPSGQFQVSTPGDAPLAIGYGDDLRLNGKGRIKADRFGLGFLGQAPVGDYELEFSARNTTVDYVIARSRGALTLDGGGSIQIAAPRQITYSGTLTPSPALPESVLSQLKTLGQPAADGRVRFDWKARW